MLCVCVCACVYVCARLCELVYVLVLVLELISWMCVCERVHMRLCYSPFNRLTTNDT